MHRGRFDRKKEQTSVLNRFNMACFALTALKMEASWRKKRRAGGLGSRGQRDKLAVSRKKPPGRPMRRWAWLGMAAVVSVGIAILAMSGGTSHAQPTPIKLYLHSGWRVESSCVAKAEGGQVSRVGFDAGKWHAAQVPSNTFLPSARSFPTGSTGLAATTSSEEW